MDIYSFAGSVLGGALASSAITPIIISTVRERWMKKVEAGYAERLEGVKDSLLREQKLLQAKLDKGNYVTQAQYDLELSSYKELWLALSNLRERWKSLFLQYEFAVAGQDNAWLTGALKEAMQELIAANDAAVSVSGRLAPFYEKGIQIASGETTYLSTMFVRVYIGWTRGEGEGTPQEASTRLNAICEGVEKIDGLIRNRLSSLRLV